MRSTVKSTLIFPLSARWEPWFDYILEESRAESVEKQRGNGTIQYTVSMKVPSRVFWDLRASLYPGDPSVPASWDERRLEDENIFEQNVIAAHLKHGKRLLDFGCGSGRHAQFLSTFCGSYVGVDISAAMIKKARSKHPDKTFVQITDKLPFSDFDIIFSCQTLKHITDDHDLEHWVSEMKRVSAPDAQFIHLDASSSKNGEAVGHSVFRPKPFYIIIFREHGFKVESQDYERPDGTLTVYHGHRVS